MTATKLTRLLTVANRWESTGKVFFNRNSDGSMTLWIRDPRLWGGNPNRDHWSTARELESDVHAVTKRTSGIEIDRQSGCLVLRVFDAYA
jgi:hypothetical protein